MSMEDELKIVKIFQKNVLGKFPDTSQQNQQHDGRAGHWLEKQMGVSRNASNAPDLLGFEMKNETTSKITFGDWVPNYFIFKDKESMPKEKGMTALQHRDNYFLTVWGQPNPQKDNRFSWSGKPVPKIDTWNDFGLILIVESSNDISIIYNYKYDKRVNKNDVVPDKFRDKDILIAKWDAKELAKKVNNKFNQKGWFICKTDSDGRYEKICFGDPITFEDWISLVKDGTVFYDSGMYEGNSRPYAVWRASNNYWNSLIRRIYP